MNLDFIKMLARLLPIDINTYIQIKYKEEDETHSSDLRSDLEEVRNSKVKAVLYGVCSYAVQ